MKRNLIILLAIILSFVSCNKDEDTTSRVFENPNIKVCDSCGKGTLKSGTYGIYGEVLWPVSGSPYNAVESPTVYVYKYVNGSLVYQGSTTASACGYYTYDTGSTGSFYVTVGSNYYLRSYPGCSTRVDYGMHAGSGSGTVTIWSPWTVVNVRCS